ncbi:PilW family protein [Salinicola aestuarinus]|uniref:PilW family protein n=1 Tax=Salinicola aestuarinus TaxID=1949082 RepID=UPI000DA2216A|nr:PilW family protein [Salinicola aestuarinus]
MRLGGARGRRAQRGMTLIELLIALAIGSIMILAISRVYLAAASGVRDYRDRTALVDCVRLLHDHLDYELRRADFWGRVPADAPRSGKVAIDGDCDGAFAFGRTADAPPDQPRGIWASMQPPQGCSLDEALADQTYLAVRYAAENCAAADCSGKPVIESFYPTIVFGEALGAEGPVNADPARDRWRYGGSLYYLRHDDDGEPALWRRVLLGGGLTKSHEVLKGVEALAFRWAVDTDRDGSAEGTAAIDELLPGDMPSVAGIEVDALVSTSAPAGYRDARRYPLIDGRQIETRPGRRYRTIRFLVPLEMHLSGVIDD